MSKRLDAVIGVTVIVVGMGLGIGGCFRGAFLKDEDAVRVAHQAGYTEAQVVSHTRFLPLFEGCSRDDAAAFRVQAKNPAGTPVTILVCMGWPFSAATVRVP